MAQPPLQRPLAIVKPTPLHPLEEIPLNLHPSGTTIASASTSAADNSRASSPSTRPAFLLSSFNLPTKGSDGDADEALAKLDRLTKQREKRIKWRKKTERLGGDSGYASDSSSSDSIDFGKAFEEVKLKITSLPGHPVVGRVRNAANRARDRIGRADTESPATSPNTEEGQDGLAYRFPLTRSIGAAARRFSRTPSPFGDLARSSSAASGPNAASSAAATPTGRGPSPGPSSPNNETGRLRGMASQYPELLVVDEEGHEQRAEEQSYGGLRRPMFLQQDQSDLSRASGVSADSTPNSTPSGEPSAHPVVFNLLPDGSSSVFAIHDEPEEHDLTARTHDSRALSRSISPSSGSDLTDSDEADSDGDSALQSWSSDDEGRGALTDLDGELLRCGAVSLKHAEAMSKEELKNQRKLMRREAKRRKRAARGQLSEGQPAAPTSHANHIGHGMGNRVSKGLHYASSQSRNRRAMERYSPNPAKQLQILTKELPRFGTPPVNGVSAERRGSLPFSAISPTVSRGGQSIVAEGRRGSLANSRRNSLADQEKNHDAPATSAVDDFESGQSLGRWNTQVSIASSRGSFRNYMRAPNVLRKRRQHKWEAEMAALEAASGGGTPMAQTDPEKELDQMLGKLAVEQAPIDAGKERYEFDVLYENQRGLLVFGIPKFSPRTLFQWDPSPWTSATNKKSPYNIANAQLPDPSWDWIYPEWLIDMTGDTDEAGWQYSGNFGRRFWPNIHFPHGKLGLPRTGMDGLTEMNARQAEKQAKRTEKDGQRDDGGLEALKRSARVKTDKWQGTPDPWTFVRRRRWIRLRRRRPLATAEAAAEASQRAKDASPAQEALTVTAPKEVPASDTDSFLGSSNSLSGSDEEDCSSDEDRDDGRDFAPAGYGASAFLSRRLPGDLVNGPNPLKFKKGGAKARRAQRHAKQFTGTLRELKSLLPSIIAGEREDRPMRSMSDGHGGVSKAARLKLNKIDARNPFISWKFVKSRLEDGDMAFASATLRAREKRYMRQQNEELARSRRSTGAITTDAPPSRAMPPQFLVHEPTPISSPAPAGSPASFLNLQEPVDEATSLSASTSACKELTREALIEINFSRVMRVFKACKLDRQRLDLWKLWLGLESLDVLVDQAKALDPRESIEAMMGSPSPPPSTHRVSTGGGGVYFSGGSSPHHRQRADKAKARWRAAVTGPDSSDVWDVLERKLDDVLLLFEFQSSRAALLRALLSIHSLSHAEHVYRDRSLRSNPVELSPTHIHGSPTEMGGGQPFVPRNGWQRSGLPRLEFFSDVSKVLNALPGPNDAETEASRTRMGQLQDASTSSLSMLLNSELDVLNLPPSAPGFAMGRKVPSRAQSVSPSLVPTPSSFGQWDDAHGMRRSSTVSVAPILSPPPRPSSAHGERPSQLSVPVFTSSRRGGHVQRTGSPLLDVISPRTTSVHPMTGQISGPIRPKSVPPPSRLSMSSHPSP